MEPAGETDGAREARRERLVCQVDALWADGPPARGVVVAIADRGVTYFQVRALMLRCEGCGTSVPQSRTRVSAEARRIWLLFHARCTDERPGGC